MYARELTRLFEKLIFPVEMVARHVLRNRYVLLGEGVVLASVSQVVIGRLWGEGDRLELAHILINSINKTYNIK